MSVFEEHGAFQVPVTIIADGILFSFSEKIRLDCI